MRKVRAGCCQFAVQPGEIDMNVESAGRLAREFGKKGCQLLVLPEMWSCGFVYPLLRDMAVRTPKVLDRVKDWASRHQMVIVGSLPEVDGDRIYNTSYVVDATGEVAGRYRKIHLFSLLGEHLHFGRGACPLVCDSSVGRLGIMICYDLRFPELARRLAVDKAEILCIPAQWPKPRIEHWSILLRARAIENQLFVIGCNGSGMEKGLQYGGASAIVSPLGGVLAEGGSQEIVMVGDMDFAEMREFRQRIPCFEDRVPKIYGLGG